MKRREFFAAAAAFAVTPSIDGYAAADNVLAVPFNPSLDLSPELPRPGELGVEYLRGADGTVTVLRNGEFVALLN